MKSKKAAEPRTIATYPAGKDTPEVFSVEVQLANGTWAVRERTYKESRAIRVAKRIAKNGDAPTRIVVGAAKDYEYRTVSEWI